MLIQHKYGYVENSIFFLCFGMSIYSFNHTYSQVVAVM